MVSPSGTVTFLFTDLVDTTDLFDSLGDEAAVARIHTHIGLHRRAIIAHAGEEVKMLGDGLMVAFSSANDAVATAVAMHQATDQVNSRRPDMRLHMRAGLHAGEPIRMNNDYFGTAVNLAWLLCHQAEAGQIFVSSVVREIAGRGRFAFRDVGFIAFKGLSEQLRTYAVLWAPAKGKLPLSAMTDEMNSAPGLGRLKANPVPSHTLVILFTDVVESTALTERLGDDAFRVRTRRLDVSLRTAVRERHGTPVEGTLLGDGLLAVFTSAQQAIQCALACNARAEEVGLQLHLGLHAGDVIREGNNVFGGAVNLAARVRDAAAPGQLLVSDVVRGLARTSGGVDFIDRGEHALKGIAEAVRLFEVRPAED